jgi:phage tail sheath protein FI
MPEYLAPGVFVEEVSFRAKSIEGVGTSVAAIVGPTRTGPLRGKPEVVTSFAEFARIYGDAADLQLGTPPAPVLNHTAIAARAFFENGGKQLFVARVTHGVNGTDANGLNNAPGSATFARRADAGNRVTFASRFPGAMGAYTLELTWRDSENLLRSEGVSAPAEGEVVFLDASGVPEAVQDPGLAAAIPAARFPMNIRALVRRTGDRYAIVANRAEIETDDATPVTADDFELAGETEGALLAAGLAAADQVSFTRVYAKVPTSGPLADGTSAELRLTDVTDLSAFIGAGWGTLRTLRGTLNAAGTALTVSAGALNPGVAAPIVVPLPALAAVPGAAGSMMVQRSFDIDVRAGGPDGEGVYAFAGMTSAPSGATSMATVMSASPARRSDRLTQPVSCAIAAGSTGEQVQTALFSLFEPAALNPPALSPTGPRYLIALNGGGDGDAPAATDYTGETDEVSGSTGFAALEDIEDISIVMAPAAAAGTPITHQGVVAAMQAHCRRMRYRVGIVDTREGLSQSEVRDFRSNFDDSRLALYFPWVVTTDPTGARPTITVPPSGFVAGIYANTDVTRGVHKSPANEPVIGALRFAQEVNRFQQELLNPLGINCLRSFPGRGHRVWGGRTLSSDPEWKYVNVRRYFLFLERSIDKSTQWVVFEPNGERLWANVRSAVEDFLYNEWFNGRLLGGSPKEAYFVRCDRSTMTQNDLDNGRLVCLVGVAPLTPAEFVIFRIGQKTADA